MEPLPREVDLNNGDDDCVMVDVNDGSADPGNDDDSDVIIEHHAGTPTEPHDVNDYEFESLPPTEDLDMGNKRQSQDEEGNPSPPRKLRRLDTIVLDSTVCESDDATGSPGMVLAMAANPQGGGDFPQHQDNPQSGDEQPEEEEVVTTDDPQDQPGEHSDSDSLRVGDVEGWESDESPSYDYRGRAWGGLPSPPNGGPGGDFPIPGVTNSQVITVSFEHTVKVEMRFNPGFQGVPNTQVRTSHWSLVSIS